MHWRRVYREKFTVVSLLYIHATCIDEVYLFIYTERQEYGLGHSRRRRMQLRHTMRLQGSCAGPELGQTSRTTNHRRRHRRSCSQPR